MNAPTPPTRSSRSTDDIPLGQLIGWLLVGALCVYSGFFAFAKWQANQADPQTTKDQIELEFAIQKHLFETVKAFGSLAFVVTAYYAWRNLKVAEQNRELAEDKQVSERFSKAVEMLGSNDKFEVQMGGIYSLERIARDSPRDYWTVVEVLAAFIRSNSPIKDGEEQPVVNPSIQIALSTLSNLIPLRQPEQEQLDLVLAHINLRGAKIYSAQLSKVYLSGSILQDAYLNYADLSGARLFEANLDGANLAGAKFIKADLTKASLNKADIYKADFSQASGLDEEQIKEANSWQYATYEPEFHKRLGLPETYSLAG